MLELIKSKGIKINWLSKEIGVANRTLYHWDKNPQSIPLGKLNDLEKILGKEFTKWAKNQ